MLRYDTAVFVQTSHSLLFPPVFHVYMVNAFLGFEKEKEINGCP